MDKLKSVFGSKKDTDTTGEGSHPAQTHQAGGLSGGENLHPVHDQYTSTAGEPTKTTDHTPHFSNSSSLNPVGASTGYGSSAQQGGSTLGSSVRPGTTPARPNPMEEESTASIKSGIIGLPQGGQHHETPTASRGFEATLPDRTIASQQHDSSVHGRDVAPGTGMLGGGAAAAPGLHRQKDHDNLRAPEHSTSPAADAAIAQPIKDLADELAETDRSFPLAGGVTSRFLGDNTSTGAHSQPHALSTNERDATTTGQAPGVLERAREALAEAAAAVTSTATNAAATVTSTATNSAGAVTSMLKPDSTASSNDHQQQHVAFAGSPGAGVGSSSNSKSEHEPVRGQMHIPGSFVETPMETPGDRGQSTGDYMAGAHRQPERSSVEPPTARGTDLPQSDSHHTARNAGIGAAGIGAAGLGAYSAGKDHQRETTETRDETRPVPSNPYSSAKIDPRVDPTLRQPETEVGRPSQSGTLPTPQRDTTSQTQTPASQSTYPTSQRDTTQHAPRGQSEQDHHYGRDAGLAGATAGGLHFMRQPERDTGRSSQTGTFPTTQRDAIQHTQNSPTSQTGTYPTSQRDAPHQSSQLSNESQREDHHGRNAGLVGAGAAATAGGLYYANQRDEHPQTGSTSDTSAPHKSNLASMVDPRVSSGSKDHTTTTGPHKSDILNRLDPTVKSGTQSEGRRDVGRDTAGSTAGAGYGAQQAATSYEPRSTHPAASMSDQRYDPSAPGAHDPQQAREHHHGRDAALVGGVGAGAGALAYGASQRGDPTQGHSEPTHDSTLMNKIDPRVNSDNSESRGSTGGYGTSNLSSGMISGSSSHPTESHQHPSSRIPQPVDSQQHSATPMGGQRYDSSAPGAQESQHHHGRDAALGAGVGAGAGALAYGASRTGDEASPQQSTSRIPQPSQQNSPSQGSHPAQAQQYPPSQGSHSAQAQQYLSSQESHPAQAQQYPTQERDRSQDAQHHYGRNAGLGAAGVGAAGAGLYAASRHGDDNARQPQTYQEHQQPIGFQQPSALQPSSAYQQPGAHQQSAYQQPGAHQQSAQQHAGVFQQPATYQGAEQSEMTQHPNQQRHVQDDQHDKRNAALAAGGVAGLAGAGAGYAYAQQDAKEAERAEKARLAEQKAHEKEQEHLLKEQQKEMERKQKEEQKAYEKEQEHLRKQQQHDLEKKQKEAEKQRAHEQKEHDKMVAAEEKKRQHEAEKEQKHQAALVAAEEKKRQHDAEQEQKHHAMLMTAEEKKRQHDAEQERITREKLALVEAEAKRDLDNQERLRQEQERTEREKQEGEKKKHHLFGFLHRDKDKKTSPEQSPRQSREYGNQGVAASPTTANRQSREYGNQGVAASPTTANRQSREYGNQGAAASPTAGHHRIAVEEVDGHNKLHKDPPKGHPAWEVLKHQQEHNDETTRHPEQTPDNHQIKSGVFGAHAHGGGSHEHAAADPRTGYSTNTGNQGYGAGNSGTGHPTNTGSQGYVANDPRSVHPTNPLDPRAHYAGNTGGSAVDPRTGHPTNTGNYGDNQGYRGA